MEERSKNHFDGNNRYFKEKIEYNANCEEMTKDNHLVDYGTKVDTWLRDSHSTENCYTNNLPKDRKTQNLEKHTHSSPQLNGSLKAYSRNSDSDYRQNYHSSSSHEVESPDSQKTHQKKYIDNPRSIQNHSRLRKSSSPFQLENTSSQTTNSLEFNANLSIDTKEVTPIKTHESPVKSCDKFSLSLRAGMFKAVRLDTPPNETDIKTIFSLCKSLSIPRQQFPTFICNYIECTEVKENPTSKNTVKSLNGKTGKTTDSQNLPSTSQQATTKLSKSSLESDHNKKKKHMENTPSDNKESIQKQSPSVSSKMKNKEATSSAGKSKEIRVERPIQDLKQQHLLGSQNEAKSKELKGELQSAQGRILKHKENTHSVPKVRESKEERSTHDSKLNADAKRVGAMAPEVRSCDKNSTKKRESPDQSAMIAITSSKKGRTSVYHGGKKCDKIPKLKDLIVQLMVRGINQTSDPKRYIYKGAPFQDLESILVQLNPDKLHRIEEENRYLLAHTENIWKFHCERRYKSFIHLKKKDDMWRSFFGKCYVESEKKLKNLTASISASASKAKPDRQIKLTTVDCQPTKRQKTDHAVMPKMNGVSSAVKPLPNSLHPSNSRSAEPVPPKGAVNHIKPGHRTIKKDAPLMHKAKKTWGQLKGIHRN